MSGLNSSIVKFASLIIYYCTVVEVLGDNHRC